MTRDLPLDLFLILLAVAGACLVLGAADHIDQLIIHWSL